MESRHIAWAIDNFKRLTDEAEKIVRDTCAGKSDSEQIEEFNTYLLAVSTSIIDALASKSRDNPEMQDRIMNAFSTYQDAKKKAYANALRTIFEPDFITIIPDIRVLAISPKNCTHCGCEVCCDCGAEKK